MLLRTPYLTAEQLRITERENQAMIEVQRRMEHGELEYQSMDAALMLGRPIGFNMMSGRCGTVACFGGWMAHVMGLSENYDYSSAISNYVSNHRTLHKLFFPLENILDHQTWEQITVEQTVEAVKHFRMTGDADEAWQLALGM